MQCGGLIRVHTYARAHRVRARGKLSEIRVPRVHPPTLPFGVRTNVPSVFRTDNWCIKACHLIRIDMSVCVSVCVFALRNMRNACY